MQNMEYFNIASFFISREKKSQVLFIIVPLGKVFIFYNSFNRHIITQTTKWNPFLILVLLLTHHNISYNIRYTFVDSNCPFFFLEKNEVAINRCFYKGRFFLSSFLYTERRLLINIQLPSEYNILIIWSKITCWQDALSPFLC